MKASRLIIELQSMINANGDKDVFFSDEYYNGGEVKNVGTDEEFGDCFLLTEY